MAEEEFEDDQPKQGIPVWVLILIAFVVLVPGACVVIAFLAAFLLPRLVESTFMTERSMAEAEILAIEAALEQFAVEHGVYPDSLEQLVDSDENGYAYLLDTDLLRDPWDNLYAYEPPTSSDPEPRVICFGADGAPGGDGLDMDFDNLTIREGDF